MQPLANVVRDAVNNVAVRRDPMEQLSITSVELLEAVQFFEDTLQMNVSRQYMLDLFRDLRHKIERREITIDGLRAAVDEYRKVSIGHATTLDIVTEELIEVQLENTELRTRLMSANANLAYEYNRGQDNVVRVWVNLLMTNHGMTQEQAYEEIWAEVSRANAEMEYEVESDDAA